MSTMRYSLMLSSLLVGGFLAGCGPSQPETDAPAAAPAEGQAAAEHADPHDVPLTEAELNQLRQETAAWSAAVERVAAYRDAIRDGANSDTPVLAHRPLDLMDNLLQWLPEIAQSNNVPKEHWQAVGENAQALRDMLNQVHTNIDAGQAPDYASVSEKIDQAVAALAAIPSGANGG